MKNTTNNTTIEKDNTMENTTITAEETVTLNKYRSEIRTILRTIDDYQNLRIWTGNRLKKKADGTDQKDADENAPDVTTDSILDNVDLFGDTMAIEDKLTKRLEEKVKQTKEWKLYFKDIKGIGPKMAAILISEITQFNMSESAP